MATPDSCSSSPSISEHNRILDAVEPAELARILPQLERITLNVEDYQHLVGESIKYCYFPTCGMISLTQPMNNGDSAEVGIVGREGVLGIPVYLGENIADHDAFVQLRGAALRIERDQFRRLIAENPSLARLIALYTNSQLSIVAHVAACNALHTAEGRLARWILSVRDRADSDSIPLTHEFLALMLGTRRATVTVTAGVLERAGLIELGRASIRVVNRERLRSTSCECYERVHALVEHVFVKRGLSSGVVLN